MSCLFFLVCTITLVQLSYRRFDFLSIGAISYIMYFSSCIVGSVWIPGSKSMLYETDISNKTYMMIFLQLLIINIVLFFSNEKATWKLNKRINYKKKKRTSAEKNNQFWNLLLFTCVLIFSYNIFFRIKIHQFFSYTTKGELSGKTDVFFSIAVWAVILCFIEAICHKRINRMIFSGILVLITVLIGSRVYIAMAMAAILVINSKKTKNVLGTNLKIAFVGGSLVIVLMLYKNIYSEVRALDFAEAIRRLKNISSIIDISEFRTINAVYNYVMDSNFKFPFIDVLARIFSGIPFINDFIPVRYPLRFSVTVQREFFSASYGLGGNFWAESYAMGGVPFFIMITFIWTVCLEKSKKLVEKQDSVFLTGIVVYCSFYIHRLDWIQVWGCIKSIFLVYICYFVWNRVPIRLKNGKTVVLRLARRSVLVGRQSIIRSIGVMK